MKIRHMMQACRAPMIALVIAALMVTGCQSGQGWGSEWVTLPGPSRALIEEDGTVHLGYFVERDIQPEYTGWHWRALSAEQSARAVRPLAADQHWSNGYSVRVADLYESDSLTPALLEPGLPADAEPPTATTATIQWGLVPDPSTGSYQLAPPDTVGQPRTPVLFLGAPHAEFYQTPEGQRRQRIAQTLAAPFQAVARVLLFPVYLYALNNVGPN